MFWPVDEEDWISFTPGTWTTEELEEMRWHLLRCLSYLTGPWATLLFPPGSASVHLSVPQCRMSLDMRGKPSLPRDTLCVTPCPHLQVTYTPPTGLQLPA